jgi:hypothetical protein
MYEDGRGGCLIDKNIHASARSMKGKVGRIQQAGCERNHPEVKRDSDNNKYGEGTGKFSIRVSQYIKAVTW